MAIAIDWGNRVIFVLRTDMALIQSSPVEVRELDLNWFRAQLKDLEDSENGQIFPDTHRHETTSTLSGIVFAHKLEIINGYTVTFEDGQYVVHLVNANSNVMDVRNPNQVSVGSANSAGLIIAEGTETDLQPVLDAISNLDGDVASVASAVDNVPTTLLDGEEVVAGISVRQAMMLKLSALVGKLQGATGGDADEWIEIIEALSDTHVRIRALCDQYGNRKQIQIDLDSA